MSGPCILVIDDSLTIRKLVELTFRGKDAELHLAASGREGIMRATALRPDVIILDFVLPDMKGPEIARRLADDPATARIPVLVMSAKTTGLAELFHGISQVAGFIPKPFTPALLFDNVRSALARAQSDNAVQRSQRSRRSAAPSAPPPSAESTGLIFRGTLGAVSFDEVIGMALTLGRRMEVRLRTDERTTVAYLNKNAICLCSSTDPVAHGRHGAVDLQSCGVDAVERAEREQRRSAKPALVTLAEQGRLPPCDLSLVLFEIGRRALVEASMKRVGGFECYERGSFPLYAEAYHRPITLGQLRLEIQRNSPMLLTADANQVYARGANFSRTLGQLDLNVMERRAVQYVDGTLDLASICARAGLALNEGATALERLCSIGLLAKVSPFPEEPFNMSRVRRALVLEPDVEGFTHALERLLKRRPEPYEVVSIAQEADILAAIHRNKPWLVMVNASHFGESAARTARALRTGTEQRELRMIAVLEEPSETQSVELTRAGFDAVLSKPVSYLDIERVVSL